MAVLYVCTQYWQSPLPDRSDYEGPHVTSYLSSCLLFCSKFKMTAFYALADSGGEE